MSEQFRDSLGTMKEDGKRNWIFAKKPKGIFYKNRTYVSIFLILLFLVSPFIKLNGEQLLLLNIFERKFIFFGFIFRPQDIYIFVITIITSIIFIILFTVIYGRLFCGWVCPQTIFMEMIFRKIEYLIEGDRRQQLKLSKKQWGVEDFLRRILKIVIFYTISLIVSTYFVAYVLGKEEAIRNISTYNLATISFIVLFAGLFFFIFYSFREQACIAVCPYGRLQGVLLDKKSIVVAYDYKRGEKRGKYRKGENRSEGGKGDCIDCGNCVEVCPTGIDIRNGTQLECINCTACIDECNDIMDKVGLPKGLIRYASEENISKGEKFSFTTRMYGYSGVLFLMIVGLFFLLIKRDVVDVTILRFPGQLYQEEQEGKIISNVYSFTVVNKSFEKLELVPELLNIDGEIIILGNSDKIILEPEEIVKGTLFIKIKKENLKNSNTKIKIRFLKGEEVLKTYSTNFMSPRY